MSAISNALLGFTTEDEALDSPQTVGDTATRLATQNPNRVQIVFVNGGGTDVWITTRATDTAGEGFVVAAGGGTVAINANDDGSLPQREFYGVVGSGTETVAVLAEVASGQVPQPDGES